VTELRTRADPGGNRVGLWVHYDGMADEIPAAALSDGTLAYLAFVALFRLEAPSTLIVIDEPESHLHPSLLVRVLDLCRSLAVDRPVVLATHSDRLLDALPDPATSVVLCELDDRLATRLLRPDPPALQRWLARYRGVGDLRATGLDRGIWADPEQR
jgi:predicted ATPase